MRPTKTTNHQEDLFRNRLSNQLNPKHELLQLSKMIPWHTMEEEFAQILDEEQAVGRQATPVRLVVGLLLLQHMLCLIRMWYVCG